jgi:hypothetical protein
MKRAKVSVQKKIDELKALYMAAIKAGQGSVPITDNPPPCGG